MEFSAEAINTLEVATLYGLLKLDDAAVRIVTSKINAMLDLYAAGVVICLMREVAKLERLPPHEFRLRLNAWAKSTGANEPGARRFLWPEPIEAVTGYLRARSSGPVAVTVSGVAPAAYFLDTDACRRMPMAKVQTAFADSQTSPCLYLLAKAAGVSSCS